MEIYKAEICLGGLLTNTVIREDLTAAEIIILRRTHGDDAVKAIRRIDSQGREYQKEYDRLVRKYGRRKVEDAFPGARPVLPQNLKDIGIVTKDGYINDEVVAKGPNNKNVKTKREKELEALGADSEEDSGEDSEEGQDEG